MSELQCRGGRLFLAGMRSLSVCLMLPAAMGWSQQNPPRQPDPEEMFRNLDRNRDGKLTMDESGPGGRQFMERLFEMVKKSPTESLSREEFLRIAEEVRRGNMRPPGGGPPPGNGPPSGGNPPGGNPGGGPPNVRFSRDNLRRMFDQFDQLDTNKDGFLDLSEVQSLVRPAGGGSEPPPRNNPGRPARPDGEAAAPRSTETPPAEAKTDSPAPQRGGRDRLTGTWRGWVVNGRGENPNTGHMEMELTIEGNRMTAKELGTNRSGGGLGGGTYTVSGAGPRGNLDAVGTSGAQEDKTFQGIYELQGDTLRWCVGNDRRARPTELASERGNYLMVLRRQP